MKLFIASPIYGSAVPAYQWSLIRTIQLFAAKGHEVQYASIENCCYLDVARNKLTAEFLASDKDLFLQIDADISWVPEQLEALLENDEDVVGAVAPYRDGSGGFPVNITNRSGKLWEVDGLPTTFLCVKRHVFNAMKHLGLARLMTEANVSTREVNCQYDNYFEFVGIPHGMMREDISFSYKCKKLGFKLWADPNMVLSHYGMTCHQGKLADWKPELPRLELKLA